MTGEATAQSLELRISVTDRCQLRCLYCMPPAGVPMVSQEDTLSSEEILRFVRIVKSGFGLSKVRITGGDPLVRPGIVDLVRMLADEGIADLALTTNGHCLAEMAASLKDAGLRRVNVSLDSLDPETARRLSRGGDVGRTLRGIEAALESGLVPVKINAVVLRSHNAHEVTDLARFALDMGCQMRFLELMPIGCAKGMFKDAFVSASEVRARLEESFRLVPLPYEAGQTSRDFLASDGRGRRGIVGLIAPHTRPFCPGCRRVRMTSTGRLIGCLASGTGPNVRKLLRSDSPAAAKILAGIVTRELARKNPDHRFEAAGPMALVGG